MQKSLLTIFAALLLACGAWSADPKTPADRQAFSAIKNMSDPQKKLDALRSFLAQYPKSSRVDAAQSLVLETLVKNFPTRTKDIHQQVNVLLKLAKGDFRMYQYAEVAGTLADAKVELPLAENISKKSLKMLHEKSFEAGIRKSYIEAKIKPPAQAELDKDYQKALASLQSTLGRIYLKEGNTAAGQPLLEAAYHSNPDDSAAAAALGMLADKAGRSDEALAYLTRARLTGKLDAPEQKRLDDLYEQQHGGSMAGFEDYLDARYASLFPSPFDPGRFTPSAMASGRTVLEELFTGAGCDPCAGADLAVDGDLERYNRKEVAVLAFDQHIPEPDPLANPDSVNRFKYYDGKGTPTLAIDGVTEIIGSNREGAKQRFEDINKEIDKALQTPPEAQIEITAWRKGDDVEVAASAKDIKSASKDLKLQIALVENRLRYSGENGIRFHPMVVRNMAHSGDGFAVEPGTGCTVQYAFDLPAISAGLKTYLDAYEKSNDRFGPITFIQEMDKINPADLSVVAFVQDTKTKHILQAAYVPVSEKP